MKEVWKNRNQTKSKDGDGMAKDVVRNYRLTKQDADRLREKAEVAGMSESEYFRLLITQKPNDYPEIRYSIKELINEVNRIGVNINEIVHNNNSELYRVADKERLVAYMRRLNETVDEVVVKLGYH